MHASVITGTHPNNHDYYNIRGSMVIANNMHACALPILNQ